MSSESTEFDQVKALEAALMAARAAAEVLQQRFRSSKDTPLAMWMKSPGALVTDADIASDRAIAGALDAAGAPGRILSEESSTVRVGEGLTWLVDPLCGTVPFSTGMGHWGLNIALRHGSELEVGVVSVPPLGEQLTAVRGKGVSRNGKLWSASAPGADLSEATVGLDIDCGREWERLLAGGLEWVPSVGQVNMFSSAAYSMAQVCLGRLAAAVFYRITPVHVAAGALIAMELGLSVTDGTGERIDWSADDKLPLVVTGWPEVHAQIIKAMRTGC